MTFHEWLREKLISRNYTQDEFGKAVGVTGQAVNHWVNGNKLPSIKNMRKIANVLNIAEQEVLEAAGLLKKTEKGEESTYNIQSRNGYPLEVHRYFEKSGLNLWNYTQINGNIVSLFKEVQNGKNL
jgi:transcriptional regulator with XRE-family HTH domain